MLEPCPCKRPTCPWADNIQACVTDPDRVYQLASPRCPLCQGEGKLISPRLGQHADPDHRDWEPCYCVEDNIRSGSRLAFVTYHDQHYGGSHKALALEVGL